MPDQNMSFSADLGGDLLSAIGDVKGVAMEASQALRDASKEAKDSQKELAKFEKDLARAEKKQDKMRDKGKPIDGFTVGKQQFASKSEALAYQENLIKQATEASVKAGEAEDKKDQAQSKIIAQKEKTAAKKILDRRFNEINSRVQGLTSTATNILAGRAGVGDAKAAGEGVLKLAGFAAGPAAAAKIVAIGAKLKGIASLAAPIAGPAIVAVGAFIGTRRIQNALQENLMRQEQERSATVDAMHSVALSQRGKSTAAQSINRLTERADIEAREAERIAAHGNQASDVADFLLNTGSKGWAAVFGGEAKQYDIAGIKTAGEAARKRAIAEEISTAKFGERYTTGLYKHRKDVNLQVERERNTYAGIQWGGFGYLSNVTDYFGIGESTEQSRERIATKRSQEGAAGREAQRANKLKQFNADPQNRINVLEHNQNLRENERFRIEKTTQWAAT